MNIATLVSAVVSSSVIAALLTALFTKLSADKKVRIETVTNERKQWREWLRTLVKNVNVKAYEGEWNDIRILRSELTVRLNPLDTEDAGILTCLDEIVTSQSTGGLPEFNDRMSLLLKHDWERVKIEAGGPGPIRIMAAISLLGTVLIGGLYPWWNKVYLLTQLPMAALLQAFLVFLAASILIASYMWLVDWGVGHLSGQPGKAKAPLAVRAGSWLAWIHNRALRVPYKNPKT